MCKEITYCVVMYWRMHLLEDYLGNLCDLLCRTATEGEMTSTLKHVKPGDAIMSLLSFLDHLARYTCDITKICNH